MENKRKTNNNKNISDFTLTTLHISNSFKTFTEGNKRFFLSKVNKNKLQLRTSELVL